MKPIAILKHRPTSGSGGGGLPHWSNVTGSGSSPLTKANSAQTMGAAGTLNFSFTPSGSVTWRVYKNGVPTSSPASLAVLAGDSIFFDFTLTGTSGASSGPDTFTVSGLYSNTFTITLQIP